MTSSLNFNDGFNQTTFVNSVGYIPAAYVPGTGAPALGNDMLQGLIIDFINTGLTDGNPTDAANIKNLFASFLNSFGASPLPQDADSFFNLWRNSSQVQSWFVSKGQPSGTSLYNYYGTPADEPFFQKGAQGMYQQLSIPISGNAADSTSDWNILTTATSPAPNPPIVYPAPNMTAIFKAAFTDFLKNYPYSVNNAGIKTALPTGSTDPTYFFTQWFKFTATTVTLQIPAPPLLSDTNSATLGTLPSYEELYYTFHTGATKADFQVAMVKFYNEQISKQGFFLPSQSLGAWVLQNTNQYSSSVAGAGPFTLIENDKAQIINRLIALLIRMISILQKVGVSQATTLKFVTSFQNVYVTLQAQIPVFSRGDKGPTSKYGSITSPIGRGTTNKEAADSERTQLNTVLNAKITQTLQSYRGIQEDTAKQIQSRVNQTNDSVSQQTDMATAFLQQLSGLVSSIFR